MEDEFYEAYVEWANDELVWGKGMFNWCRNWNDDTPSDNSLDLDVEIPF